jgi:hypothetical protein
MTPLDAIVMVVALLAAGCFFFAVLDAVGELFRGRE